MLRVAPMGITTPYSFGVFIAGAEMRTIRLFLIFLWAALCGRGLAADHSYPSGFSVIEGIGSDLYRSLSVEERALINPEPVMLDISPRVFVRSCENRNEKPHELVSAGFVALVNQLAHARAIDRHKRGYLKSYYRLLESSPEVIPPQPGHENPQFWSNDLMNEQCSNFNSIIGLILGIELAHEYLGDYARHPAMLASSGSADEAINNVISAAEWEQAYREGTEDSLHAACMMEGALPILEAIDKMKHRPYWTAYFVPDAERSRGMRREIAKIQQRFLRD